MNAMDKMRYSVSQKEKIKKETKERSPVEHGVSFLTVLWRNEDELPKEMTERDYRDIFEGSRVDFVRLFPYVVIDGKEHYLRIKN